MYRLVSETVRVELGSGRTKGYVVRQCRFVIYGLNSVVSRRW
jgi:hypothetical protein